MCVVQYEKIIVNELRESYDINKNVRPFNE